MISYYEDDDLKKVIKIILDNNNLYDMICVADSFGNMDSKRTNLIFKTLLSYLNCLEINIGYHIHENIGNGFSNALTAIESGIDFIDTSLNGLGKGNGNLIMEDLLTYLNCKNNKLISDEKIMILLKFFENEKINFNQVLNKLQGIYNIHPNVFNKIKNDESILETFKSIKSLTKEQKYHYNNL